MELQVVCGAPTHVFSLRVRGALSCKVPLILIIPGTPGICHFYIPFASRLFGLGQGKLDVSIVSNAGHSPGHYKESAIHPSGISSTSQDLHSEATDWYTLQDQVSHKIAFIQQEAVERNSLILIGHSVGCWIVLKMLQHLIPAKVEKVILLFPAIEKMSLTANANSYVSYLWSSLQKPFLALTWLLSMWTPSFVKTYLCGSYFYKTPPEHLKSFTEGIQLIDEKCVYNQLQTARHELHRMNDPPFDVIDANIDKIVFYYGVGDRWNVESCYEDMAARYPGKEVHLCPQNIPHAFVEYASDEMAELVHSKLKKIFS